MSEIIVGNKHTPFSWLPNYIINDPNVSAEALAAALYLNGKPEGWRVRPFDVRKRFGWGEYKWEKVSKELQELNLMHKIITKEGSTLWFELRTEIKKPTRENCGPQKADPGKSRVLERKRSTNKDDLQSHDHMTLKKEPEPSNTTAPKPPMKERLDKLSFDEKCIYEKLKALKGMFAGTALAIVEGHTIGKINNIYEMAFQEGVKNPGGYIVKTLYTEVKEKTEG